MIQAKVKRPSPVESSTVSPFVADIAFRSFSPQFRAKDRLLTYWGEQSRFLLEPTSRFRLSSFQRTLAIYYPLPKRLTLYFVRCVFGAATVILWPADLKLLFRFTFPGGRIQNRNPYSPTWPRALLSSCQVPIWPYLRPKWLKRLIGISFAVIRNLRVSSDFNVLDVSENWGCIRNLIGRLAWAMNVPMYGNIWSRMLA